MRTASARRLTDFPAVPVPAKSGDYLPGLHGLRALAVAGVIFHHLAFTSSSPFWSRLAFNARFGVDVFFVLSGYLITHLLLAEERKRGQVSLRKFYARRALRILPPALLYLAVVAGLASLGWVTAERYEFAYCLGFARNWVVGNFATMHFWSLSLEEQFYLVWPFAFVALSGRRRFELVCLLLPLSALLYQFAYRSGAANLNPWRTDLHLEPLLWGVWGALAMAQPGWRAQLEKIVGDWPAAAALAFLVVTFSTRFLEIPILRSFVGHLSYATVAYLVLYLVCRPASLGTKALEWSPLRALGILSYGLYLWQQVFMPEASPGRQWTLQELPWSLCGTLLAATFSYWLLERPLLRWRRRWR